MAYGSHQGYFCTWICLALHHLHSQAPRAGAHEAEGEKIMSVFTGVRDGDPSVLPALSLILFLPLDLGGGRETFWLKAFKLTVCKLFKSYQRKGQLEGLKPFANPPWHILDPFLTRAKKQIQFCSAL